METVSYAQLDFPTLIAEGRAKHLVSVFVKDLELLVDHETQTFCIAPGRFPDHVPGY